MAQAAILCSVDVVLLTLINQQLHVLLLRRDHAPYDTIPALPGGFVHPEQDAEAIDAAIRVLRQKAGIDSPYLEQLGCFSGRARDPRGWSIAIAYVALVDADWVQSACRSINAPETKGAARLSLVAVDQVRKLPFDHEQIIHAAVQRLRNKASYSTLPFYLCPPHFTLPQLQSVYEAVIGEPINKVSFRRKIDELDVIEPIEGAMQTSGAHRPAQLYRLKPSFHRRLSYWQRALLSG